MGFWLPNSDKQDSNAHIVRLPCMANSPVLVERGAVFTERKVKESELERAVIERIGTKFAEIDRKYKDAKKEWQHAEKKTNKKYDEYLATKNKCISEIEECGQRLELEIIPALEDLLRKEPEIRKLPTVQHGISRLGGIIDWGQRIAFILSLIASIVHP